MPINKYPCQQLHGGTGSAIYMNTDGLCSHPECNPVEFNSRKKQRRKPTLPKPKDRRGEDRGGGEGLKPKIC